MPSAPHIIDWVARHIVPHERSARNWLIRRGVSRDDADDIVHDAYCRLCMLTSTEAINRPAAYFMTIVRNLLIERLRREKVVAFERLTELHASTVIDSANDVDAIVDHRRILTVVAAMIDALPERARQIFVLRRIEGLSQREIAKRLGVSECVVENDASRGLHSILAALRADGSTISDDFRTEPSRRRRA